MAPSRRESGHRHRSLPGGKYLLGGVFFRVCPSCLRGYSAANSTKPATHTESLLKLWAAIAFIYDGVLDSRQDIPRQSTLRALERRDRIGQLGPADAAVELV